MMKARPFKSLRTHRVLAGLLAGLLGVGKLSAASEADTVICYKHAAGTNFDLYILKPKSSGGLPPGFLFFHGGGWNNGSAEHSLGFLEHFRDAGFVCASAEYRCRDSNGGSTPMDATRDARSALRSFIAHAKELGFDPQQILVGGSSAGGHLACMTALGDGLGEPDEEKIPAPRVSALLLWNPVVDTTDTGYGGKKRFGDLAEKYSPVHLLRTNSPPTLVQHGDADQTVPYENAQRFVATAQKLGIAAKLVTYPGGKHTFYAGAANKAKLEKSYQEADDFLKSLKLWPAGDAH